MNHVGLFKNITKFSQEQCYLSEWESPVFLADKNNSNFSFIICTYGSFSSKHQVVGIKWTVNDQMNLIDECVATVSAFLPIHTELLAISTGVEEITSRGLSQYVILIDFVILSHFICGMASTPGELSNLIKFCVEVILQSNGNIK